MRGRATAAFLVALLAGSACAPELHELNLAIREGRPYRPAIVHPAFPAGEAPDSLVLARQQAWNDLEALLTADALAAIAAAPSPTALQRWIDEFWAPRDPLPTTPVNERRLEHERRLATARRRFPSPRPPFYDARGRLYVLGGEPELAVAVEADISEEGYEPPVEIWRLDGMLVAFQSFANSGVYAPSGMPAAHEGLFYMMAGGRAAAELMLERGELAEEEGRLERYRYQSLGAQLPLAVSADFYRAPADSGGGTLLRLYYAFAGDSLAQQADSADGRPHWRFRESCALQDPARKVLRLQGERSWTLPVPDWPGGTSITGLVERALAAGDYELTFHVRDLGGAAEALAQQPLHAPRFAPDSLAISDLSLFRVEDPQAARPGLGRPAPSHRFRQGEFIGLACEIYGLGRGLAGEHRFRLRAHIGAQGQATAAAAIEQSGRGEQASVSLVLATADLAPGDYRLSITVDDEERRRWALAATPPQARRQRDFTVIAGDEPAAGASTR